MIPHRRVVCSVLVLAAVAGATSVSSAQAPVWVSKVKAAPQDYRDRPILLRGDAVEVRGASPASTHGVYRLVDASDPSGVLIRSSELPTHSGPFKVEARLAPELLSGGSLLLDEVHRRSPFQLIRVLPRIVAAAGALGALLFLSLYLQAKHTERRHRLEPPIWLIPTAPEPPPTWHEAMAVEGGGSPHHFNYRLEYVTEQQGRALALASRRMGHGLLAAGAIAVGGAGWYLATRAGSADRPMFALLAPETASNPMMPAAVTTAEPEPTAGTDSLVLRLGGGASQPRASPSQEPPTRPEEPAPARVISRRSADTTGRTVRSPALRPPAAETAVTGAATPTPRVVEPSPPPPPPPVVVAPADTVVVAAPDPETERRAAHPVLEQGAARFVAAAAGRQMDALAALYPSGSNPAWRSRFLAHVRDYAPTVSLGAVDRAVLTESGAEAVFTVSFRWRGNFGVERRGDARFAATAQRVGPGWGFVGVRLLESFP
ncbi:MAG TPA: hypothetical protein VGA42_09895 [Gemmatimonadales bacterium]